MALIRNMRRTETNLWHQMVYISWITAPKNTNLYSLLKIYMRSSFQRDYRREIIMRANFKQYQEKKFSLFLDIISQDRINISEKSCIPEGTNHESKFYAIRSWKIPSFFDINYQDRINISRNHVDLIELIKRVNSRQYQVEKSRLFWVPTQDRIKRNRNQVMEN